MFDIGASELLVIVIVAIIVIGPKELPLALRTAGRWIGKIRRASTHFRTGLDAMIREAELEEMDRKWKEQNERIMAKYPDVSSEEEPVMEPLDPGMGNPDVAPTDAITDPDVESASSPAHTGAEEGDEPALPFDKPGKG